MTGRVRPLVTAAVAAAVVTFPSLANAQEFPTKPITLIVPFPAGGPTDLALRALGERASKHLGQPVIVENKSGGAGTVGPATMATSSRSTGRSSSRRPCSNVSAS